MENYYEKIEKLGSGAFGDVFSAFHKPTGEIVAVKEMKEKFAGSWEDCLNQPEIRCSLALKAHPNIVQLKNVIKNYQSVSLVFELMDANLLEFMQSRQRPYTEAEIRNICFQILKGLDYIHHKGYFHRDLKPENLLVKQGVIKIGDLGSAVEIDSAGPLESYIGTIWYRAPEVLLGDSSYGPPVDMWAVGAIMAELFTLRPLFPGKDVDHQMYKICRVIGSPTWETWPEGINYGLPRADGVRLSSLIPSASESALKLISSLCSWGPHKRPTAPEALQHPFFLGSYQIPRAIVARPVQSISDSELQTLCIQQH